jgi:flagellar basal body L-ring protein FlgH
VARITGTKKVTVDGRMQDITLSGAVRAEDVSARRIVRSSSIADAVITYNGKKIAPKNGILGKIVGILWP